MPKVTWEGKEFDVDNDGFLLKYADPLEQEWIDYVCKMQNVVYTERHAEILAYIRVYYEREGIAPRAYQMQTDTNFPLKELYELFPAGIIRGAAKMAGCPRPVGCL